MNWSEPINISTLNSEEDDFAPAYNKYQNLLYFNSARNSYSMFFSCELKENNAFGVPFLRTDELNKAYNNQSYITFVNQDNCIFSSYHQKLARPFINLFNSYYKKNKWTSVSVIESLAGEYFISQPTTVPGCNFLIFSSDKNINDTDTDLYIAFLQDNGSWGEVAPLQILNSPGNEITPFLANDTTLFFASNGLGGPGGYDIFVSYSQDGVWTRPFPLSSINTQFDESDPCLLPDNTLIFAGNRPGGKGKLDLYMSKILNEDKDSNDISDFEISAAVPSFAVKQEIVNLYDNNVSFEYLFDNNVLNFNVLRQIIKLDSSFNLIYNFKNQLLKDTINYIINSNRIANKIKLVDNPNLSSDAIISNTDDLFMQSEINNKKSEIIPNKIEISYFSRPYRLFKSGECFFISNNQSFKISDLEAPSNMIILDLKDSLLKGINNFVIRLKAIDINEKTYFKDLDFLISSKESKEMKIYLFNDIPYRKTSVSLPENQYLKEELAKYLNGNVIKNSDEILIESSENETLELFKIKLSAKNIEPKINKEVSKNVINIFIKNK